MNKNNLLSWGAIALAITLLSGCAFQNVGTFDDSESTSESTAESSAVQTATIGETISTDEFTITLNAAKFSRADILGSEPEYDAYLILDVTIENLSEEDNSISSLMSFTLQGSDSFDYSQSLTAKKKGNLDGDIKAGGKLRGQIAYDVSKLDSYEFSYRNSLFSDSVSFQIQSTEIK